MLFWEGDVIWIDVTHWLLFSRRVGLHNFFFLKKNATFDQLLLNNELENGFSGAWISKLCGYFCGDYLSLSTLRTLVNDSHLTDIPQRVVILVVALSLFPVNLFRQA